MKADQVLQAIHDMQSPLSVLSLMVGTLTDMPTEKRTLIEAAVARVLGISDHLRSYGQDEDPTQRPEILEKLLLTLLDEKRIEFSPQRTEFHFLDQKETVLPMKLKTPVQSLDFQRVMSNLLNNAAEASAKGSPVIVRIMKWQNAFCIAIEDEGCGFDPYILKQAGSLGVSTKPRGMGRGLFNAIQIVEREWAGELIIDSVPQSGTVVRILFPLA